MDEPDIPDLSLYPDTIPVIVSSHIQLCPALILGSTHALPGAVKHMYSRLAAAANEVDQGVPDVIISLISDGNSLSTRYLDTVETALRSVIRNCGTWLISSGEVQDPLSRVASNAMKEELDDEPAEVLHILVNSTQRAVADDTMCHTEIVDTSLNTLMILTKSSVDAELPKMRAATIVKLSHPPPALLIGVPSEPMQSATYASPILLSPSDDKHPFAVAIFAGASEMALEEMMNLIENGVPVIVLEDSCELCALFHSAYQLILDSSFDENNFTNWLTNNLTTIGLNSEKSLEIVQRILANGIELIEFINIDQLNNLGSIIVDRCLECSFGEEKAVLLLAAKLNTPSVLSSMDVATQLDEHLLTTILCECVDNKEDQLSFLSSVLQLNPPIRVTSNMLIRMMNHADEHFFSTIVLCQCLGLSYVPMEIHQKFANDVQRLVKRLSFGVDNLFDPNAFCNDQSTRDNDESIRILAIWSLLLHRPGIVKCLAAFVSEPVAFALILARCAKSLARESHDYHFYEKSLNDLAAMLTQTAAQLFDGVFQTNPAKAYKLLCTPIEHFHAFNMTQLAFHCNAREMIAHEACQKWVHRKLYGNLQAKPGWCPKWLKIIVAAIFILPIKMWMLIRPRHHRGGDVATVSPTVALLDVSRVTRQRAVSTYSVISSRSDAAFTTLTAPLSTNFGVNSMNHYGGGGAGGADSATPQSMVFPLNIEEFDKDSRPFGKKKIRRAHPPSISTFYSTPIVKYWLSLLFRIIYIGCLAYSVVQPGCGSNIWDTIVWVWSLLWWCETAFVLHSRARHMPISLMPWRVFDVGVFLVFLVLILVMKVFPMVSLLSYVNIDSMYAAKVVSALFMLYVSYSTLFTYIPLSDIFGPMIVRVKLMLLRDFTNFLLMVALVMLSSAVAIQAVVYPDRHVDGSVVRKTMSWIWLSLFITDLSTLSESETCRKSFLGAPKKYCSNLGEYANTNCPSQSIPAYFVLLEYLVLLKLLLWPILFAFFSKTAKSIDEEADKIWRFQLYSLADEFRLRPALPPPFTIVCVLCSALGCCRGMWHQRDASSGDQHPDYQEKWKLGNLYRNPSVPDKNRQTNAQFWRRLAIDHWRKNNVVKKKEKNEKNSEIRELANQIRMLMLRESYGSQSRKFSIKSPLITYTTTADNIQISKLHISNDSTKSWNKPIGRYDAPFYCKPAGEFAAHLQKHVDVVSEQNLGELKRQWRGRQANEVLMATTTNQWRLTSSGFPMNPNGRMGICGRGNLPKFGPNRRAFYIILRGETANDCRCLIDCQTNSLPNEWHLEQSTSKDEHLTTILKQCGISDADAQMFSMRRLDTSLITTSASTSPPPRIPANDTSPAHIAHYTHITEDDTDNAWTLFDVWAISLRDRRVRENVNGYEWMMVEKARMPQWQRELANNAKFVYGFN